MARKAPIDNLIEKWRSILDPVMDKRLFEGDMAAKQFTAPAAYHVDKTAHDVVYYVVLGGDSTDAMNSIEELIRLVALRGEPASRSLACFYELRSLVLQETGDMFADDDARSKMYARVDTCALHATDVFVESRERLAQVTLNELKRRDKMLEKIISDPRVAGEV